MFNSFLKRFSLRQEPQAGHEPKVPPAREFTIKLALDRIRRNGPTFKTIIDVGASDGRWTDLVLSFFPDKQCLLLDANPIHEAALQRFCSSRKCCRYLIAAAAGHDGHLYFDGSDPLGGQASLAKDSSHQLAVPCRRIDSLVDELELPGPYLLKLDTHGFEKPILEGAEACLAQASIVIIECYLFDIAPGVLRLADMCKLMESQGFRCIDMADPMRRQLDGAWWQVDLVFVPSSDAAFTSNNYR